MRLKNTLNEYSLKYGKPTSSVWNNNKISNSINNTTKNITTDIWYQNTDIWQTYKDHMDFYINSNCIPYVVVLISTSNKQYNGTSVMYLFDVNATVEDLLRTMNEKVCIPGEYEFRILTSNPTKSTKYYITKRMSSGSREILDAEPKQMPLLNYYKNKTELRAVECYAHIGC